MGQRRLAALRPLKEVSILAVCDVDAEKAKSTAKALGCDGYTDYRSMEKLDLDCVVVSTPNYLHHEVCLSFLRAGKNVMCEKPLAITPHQAWQMVDEAREAGVFLKTASNHRYMPNILKAHEIVSAGGIGRPLCFRGFIGHGGGRFSSNWFLDQKKSGGGTLMDNGCHILDLMRWFVGGPIQCTGFIDTLLLKIKPLEDNAFVILKMRNNAYASINSSWTEWFGYLYFEVYGDKGFVIVDCRYGNKVTYGERDAEHVSVYDYTNLPSQSYRLEMADLVSSLLAKRQPQPSGEDGAKVVDLIHAIYESSRTGRTVAFER